MQVHGYLSVVSLKYVVETIQEKVSECWSSFCVRIIREATFCRILTLCVCQILHIEAKPKQSLVRQVSGACFILIVSACGSFFVCG